MNSSEDEQGIPWNNPAPKPQADAAREAYETASTLTNEGMASLVEEFSKRTFGCRGGVLLPRDLALVAFIELQAWRDYRLALLAPQSAPSQTGEAAPAPDAKGLRDAAEAALSVLKHPSMMARFEAIDRLELALSPTPVAAEAKAPDFTPSKSAWLPGGAQGAKANFYDGDTGLFAVRVKEAGKPDYWEYAILNAHGDSETPIELRTQDGDAWGWEWESVNWYMPMTGIAPAGDAGAVGRLVEAATAVRDAAWQRLGSYDGGNVGELQFQNLHDALAALALAAAGEGKGAPATGAGGMGEK